LKELAILRKIFNNSSITHKALAEAISKSERTVKNRTVELQAKGLLRRKNGNQNVQWEVLIDV
jgi:DNA-binding Lrp family transcriptional regulator